MLAVFLCYYSDMKKHYQFFASLIAFIFLIEGATFLVSVKDSFSLGLPWSAAYSLFIAFVHFFIAYGLLKRKHWAPHLGIFFELYLVLNFVISNFSSLYSSELLPSVVTVLSVSAFITATLFVIKNQFNQ